MMNFKKIMSLFLAALMLCGAMAGLSVITVSADETEGKETDTTEESAVLESVEDLYTELYASPEAKLATMKKMTTKGNYEIWALESSGEVAVRDLTTGQVLFTNPYDVGAANSSDKVKNELLSQIIVKFDENGHERTFSSFEYAALRDQIKVKNIKNGIRVEYTIGREETKRLVPRMIRKDRFEDLILKPMETYYGVTYEEAKTLRYENGHPLQVAAFQLCKQMSYFPYKDLDDYAYSDRLTQEQLSAYPILAKMDIYILDPDTTITEIEKIEEVIKTACPNYSYEELDYDHQLTEYVGEEENPPVFKMALEYTIDADGFTVRLPANGIRFNESLFQLTDVSVLPYMGAGNNTYEGYTFFPDGSGALFSFEDLKDENTYSVASKIYGVDYAYHKIVGTTYQQTVRYPVFGIVENTRYYDCITLDEETGENVTTRISGVIYDAVLRDQENNNTSSAIYKQFGSLVENADIEEVQLDRGYVAIIEEGDALTTLANTHAGVLSPYDTVQMNFAPRPKDSYNMADAISVGTNSEWTVVSDRKYVGNYKIHYVMLSDKEAAEEGGLTADQWHEATWLGMAKAYRQYLISKGVLSALPTEATSGNLPLYIESFGAMETVEKILSVPVNVMKPLTSAEDVKTMYEELSKAGATNINFKLTGYANGGVLYSTVPYKLKWEKAVSKEMTMQELFDYANDVEGGTLGLYPDFDFSYMVQDEAFDGFTMSKHAVRTIDDRYIYEREYIATQQKYDGYLKMVISPAYFEHFYTKLMKNYLKHDNVTGISVGSLGNALNSDFDEDEPYNREDSKSFVKKALAYISGQNDGNMKVMVDGGNAYTWQYVDHILGAPLDSSRYIKASYSVPFIGVVLHGYMNFAGSPLNMEGDEDYAKLKAIENGASVYFTLSYQNTQILKEDTYLSQYYSIRYDIWKDDVVEIYNELNRVLGDVQDKPIVDHQFLAGVRVPDEKELDRDILDEFNAMLDYQQNKAEYEEQKKAQTTAEALDKIATVESAAEKFVTEYLEYYNGNAGAVYLYAIGNKSFENRYAAYVEAKDAYDAVLAEYEAADEAGKAELAPTLAIAETAHKQALGQLKTLIRNVGRSIYTIETMYNNLQKLLEDAKSGALLIKGMENCPPYIITEIEAQLANTEQLLAENVGITFNLSLDKAEVDTVLRAHIATLIFSCHGESNATGIGTVGKAENLYEMLASGEYGLLITELDTLRYLKANRDLTDAELIAKYGLSENAASEAGLTKYIYELMADSHEFDPLLAETPDANANGVPDGIDRHISEYVTYVLFTSVTEMADNAILPTLNFTPTRINDNELEVKNTKNNSAVTLAITKEIEAVLTGKSGALAEVTDGNYDLDAVFSSKEMDKLVDKAVEIINQNIRTETNPNPSNPVIYATPETMKTDVRNFIEGVYYQAVIRSIAPAKEIKLQTLTTTSTTDASIALLLDLRLAAYGEVDTATKYKTYVDLMLADAEIMNSINLMNENLNAAYGDVRGELFNAFLKAFATAVLGSDKAPTLSQTGFKADGDTIVYRVKDKGAEVLEQGMATLDWTNPIASVEALVDEIVALHEGCDKLGNGYDVEASSANYVYYAFLQELKALEGDTFFYDDELAVLDAAVRASVAEKNTAILATLPTDATALDVMDAILTAMADGNFATDLASELVANVTHKTDSKNPLEDDVLAYYLYSLTSSFEDYELGDSYTMKQLPDGVVEKKVTAALDTLLTKNKKTSVVPTLIEKAKASAGKGETVNYAFDAVLTDEELAALVDDMMDALLADEATKVKKSHRDELEGELVNYLKHAYYTAVLDELSADKRPTFHVSEVYVDSLYGVTMELKELMYYFVSAKTGMTKEEIDSIIRTGATFDQLDEEDEETNRYLSDDGRIVSVTYGTPNANGTYAAYKTFILNYNNFSVNVVYDEITYTIPAYGYVVVDNQ